MNRQSNVDGGMVGIMLAGLIAGLVISPQVLAVAVVMAGIVVVLVRFTPIPWWGPLLVAAVVLGVTLLVREHPWHDIAVMTRRFFRAGFNGHFEGTLERHWREWLAIAFPFGLALGSVVGVVGAMSAGRRDVRRGRRPERRPRAGALRRARVQRERERPARKGFVLGVDDRGRRMRLTESELNLHALVCGASGSGKTTTMLVLAAGAIREGWPVVFVDLKGSPAVHSALAVEAQAAGRRFWLWSLEGPERWNPLARGDATELKDKLMDMEAWSEPHYKRAAEYHLQTVIQAAHALDGPRPLTLARIVELCDPRTLGTRLRGLPAADARRLAGYLDGLRADQQSAIGGLTNRLAVITQSSAGRWLEVSDAKAAIDLHRCLKDGDVVVFSLNSSRYGELAAQLGGLVIADLKTVAGAFIAAGHKTPALIVVDEVSALDGDQLLGLNVRGREAGFCELFGTQELADLERMAPGFRDQIFGSTTTKIAHRQEVPDSAGLLARSAGTHRIIHETRQVDRRALLTSAAMGSERDVDAFDVHPNVFKRLRQGEAVVIRKHPQYEVRRVAVVPHRPPRDGSKP